jgi:hypothetical protein
LPQVAGTYSGPTTDTSIQPPQQVPTWSLKLLRPGASSFVFRNCSGTLAIQQSGSTLTGSFTQDVGCSVAGGSVSGQINGVIADASGKVTFSLRGPDADPLAWTGFAQCAAVTPGTTDFTGTIAATDTRAFLDASLPHDALVDCPGQGAVTVNVHIRAAR